MPTKLSGKFQSVIFIIFIIILGATIYSNSLGGHFIWDDAGLIKENIYIRSWSSLPQVFTKNIWAGITESSTVYRPLQMVTYLADYSLWKLDARGYHLTNILLHISAALALYWLVNLLFNQRILALFSSLIFISHPVQVEAVSYISGRADPLAAIFILLSCGFYVKFLETKRIVAQGAMLLSFILALLSRENALILPVLLILYHYTFKKKLKFQQFWPVLSIAGIYIILRLAFINTVFYDNPAKTTLIQRLPGFLAAVTNYTGILFWPFGLHMEYGNRLFSFFSPEAILGSSIILLLLIWVCKSKPVDKPVFFSISWLMIALLPVSNLYPLNAYMAEHWLYLPLIGFSVILAKAFTSLYLTGRFRWMALSLFICLLASYSYLTIRQNIYWRSELSFYKRTLEYAPGSARAHNNLGLLYSGLGNKNAAMQEYLKAIAIDPGLACAYRNLGDLYCEAGNSAQGIQMYLAAIRINPRYAEAYNNLGNVYVALGRNREALKYCRRALEFNNALPAAYYNLGNAYYNLGQNDLSIKMLEKSVQLAPDYLEAYNNLASGYAQMGNFDEAIKLWNKCIKLEPDFMTAHFNLSVFYFKLKQYGEAIRHCDRVVALGGKVDVRFLEKLKPFRDKK
jgi:pentatricopeptide repeat protein